MKATGGGADRAALQLATLFGAGRAPIVSGTVGTAASMPLAIVLSLGLPPWGFALATLAVAGLAVWASDRAAALLGAKDPGAVVIDETAGLLTTLIGLPATWSTFLGGFVLFRIMDVVKPPPARRAERLPGGWGIVTDDLIAGLYANLVLHLLRLAVAS